MTCYQLTLSPPSQTWEGVRGRASLHPVGQVIIVIILNLTPLTVTNSGVKRNMVLPFHPNFS
jgi:hypothetical protein